MIELFEPQVTILAAFFVERGISFEHYTERISTTVRHRTSQYGFILLAW